MHRRQVLKAALSGTVSLALVGVHRAVQAGADLNAEINKPFLNTRQQNLIASIAELIIPRTETSGAIDAGVPHFIELMLSDWYTTEERQPFVDGLASLEQYAAEHHDTGFLNLANAQQIEILQSMEETEFFNLAKELTVLGYYTSEVGVEAELFYNPMPGVYKGDFDFSEIGKQQVN